jgi:hypothetical protein
MKLHHKALLIELESKLDKNNSPFWKLKLAGFSDYFYAFANDYTLKESTLKVLKESPDKLLNQLVLVTYEELPHQNSSGTFKRVKEIQIL